LKKREISAAQAAEILDVSDRYIREALSSGKIRGKKVGHKWFIDEASLLGYRDSRLPEVPEVNAEVPEVNAEVPEVISGTTSDKGSGNKSKPLYAYEKSTGTPENLVCFQLAKTAFEMPGWQNRMQLHGRLKLVEEVVFGSLGAGYHSFGRKKHEYYALARAELGAALGLIYRSVEAKKIWENEVAFIETKLLPAFASLIKRVEKMSRKDYGQLP